MSEQDDDKETIRIRLDMRFRIPKGEFNLGRFDLDAAAEAVIRSVFADEWWVEGRSVDLGAVRAKLDNESAMRARRERAGKTEKKR